MNRGEGKRKVSPAAGPRGKAQGDREAMRLAETTDVSPNQAKELLRKHGKQEATKRARNFKAEG